MAKDYRPPESFFVRLNGSFEWMAGQQDILISLDISRNKLSTLMDIAYMNKQMKCGTRLGICVVTKLAVFPTLAGSLMIGLSETHGWYRKLISGTVGTEIQNNAGMIY